jgi:hypothetical protein
MCFRACVVLAQLSFEVRSKELFDVPYNQEMIDPRTAPLPEPDGEYNL